MEGLSWSQIAKGARESLKEQKASRIMIMLEVAKIRAMQAMELTYRITTVTRFSDSLMAGAQAGLLTSRIFHEPLPGIAAGVVTFFASEGTKGRGPFKLQLASGLVRASLAGTLWCDFGSSLPEFVKPILIGGGIVTLAELSGRTRTGINNFFERITQNNTFTENPR